MGSPALGVEAGIRKASLCAAETGELCKASPGAGMGVGDIQFAFACFHHQGCNHPCMSVNQRFLKFWQAGRLPHWRERASADRVTRGDADVHWQADKSTK